MLDIPELNDMVCRLLGPRDLAQCARVSQKWNSIVAPYLWRDLSRIKPQHKAFFTMVLKDYSRKHGNQKIRGKQHGMKRFTQEPSFHSSLALRRYGHLVEQLPSPSVLHDGLEYSITNIQQREASANVGDTSTPTPTELFRHLFECFPRSQVDNLILDMSDSRTSYLVQNVADLLLPRVRYLQVNPMCIQNYSQYWDLRSMLDLCSSRLERLAISINMGVDDAEDEEQRQGVSEPLTGLKELALVICHDRHDRYKSKAFWKWLWKHCTQVEKLTVDWSGGIMQNLLEGMATWMPKLHKIRIGRGLVSDGERATLLSGSCQGWSEVDLVLGGDFGMATRDALMRHRSTLERLYLELYHFKAYDYLMQVLTSSPNLRIISIIASWNTIFPTDVFTDQDPHTGALKEWECEGSLEELRIEIVGIPRPDVMRTKFKETYPGQGQEMQRLIFARIARLTSLKVLQVHENSSMTPSTDCLEMSLASGLHQLSSLKELKELVMPRTGTKVNLEEVQWMAEHWPKLRIIHGLRLKGRWSGPARWLRRHHPEIVLK
ncbi:hypothetical protein B0O80DRAFT_492263 [Mortierella sp. GBAus27b]|nr:hypothetical protein BGX31_010272 [Mortierella sp. GBA43]KAI8363102.1 hypothetical protein B0O80DRAFT_492263 [Mortierella sp. GBAus27b]